MKYFFIGFATVAFGCLILAAIPFALWLSLSGPGFSEHTLKTLQVVTSPGGSYVATAYTDMGGGAAGWCALEVNVRLVGTEMGPNDNIFSSRCGTKVQLTWDNDRSLAVTFTPSETDFGISHEARSKDGSVKIRYVEETSNPTPN